MKRAALLMIGVCCFMQGVAHAQTSGTISGVVKDESGGVLPGVTVEVTNVERGIARSVVSDENGHYRFVSLGPGAYEAKSSLEGFRAAVRSGINLTIGQEAVVDFVLQVGELAENVLVTGEAPLVDTTSSELGGLVGEKQMQDLPLNGRSYDQLITLSPGVLQFQTRGTGIASVGTGSLFSVSGLRLRSNKYTIDGLEVSSSVSLSTNPGGVSGNNLGVEAIREFKVVTNTYTAEYGKKSGGHINLVTKSGTNELHGSVFEFHRDDRMDAANFFDPAGMKPKFVRDNFGFSLGGPIVRNRSFFFGNFEGLRQNQGTTGTLTVPDANAHNGFIPNAAGQLVKVTLNPTVVPYLALYPLPNGANYGDGTGAYSGTTSPVTKQNYYMFRIDHQLSQTNTLYGRFSSDGGTNVAPSLIPTTVANSASTGKHMVIEDLHVFSPSVLNVARFGYNRSDATATVDVIGAAAGTGLGFIAGRDMGIIQFRVSGSTSGQGLASVGNGSEQWFVSNLFMGSDQISWTREKHSVKTGLEFQLIQRNEDGAFSQRGEYTFAGLSDFLAGKALTFRGPVAGGDSVKNWRQSYVGAYVQDEYRVAPRLTLNLGLRWEVMTAPTEANGRASSYTIQMVNGNIVADTNPAVGTIYHTDKGNFAPRTGFAWSLSESGRSSLRGGAGIFFDQIEGEFRAFLAGNPPFYSRVSISNPPFPNALINSVLTPEPNGIDPNLKTPKAVQYNLTLEHQLASDFMVSVGYAGSHGYNLTRSAEINAAIPQILADGSKYWPAGLPRANPALGSGRYIWTDSRSVYNALQLSAQKRSMKGLRVQVSYTLSKTMDDANGVFSQEALGEPQGRLDPTDLSRDWGRAAFDARHNLSINGSYEVPGDALPGALGQIFGGWQLNAIVSAVSGTPLTAQVGFNRSRDLDSRSPDRPNLAPGASDNPVLGGPTLYFDPTAFLLPAVGTYGNVGRNTIEGPGLFNLDFSMVKNISIPAVSRGFKIQFRGEVFNLTNHVNFGVPNLVLFNSDGTRNGSAGVISSTATSSRQVQLGLKLLF